MENTTWESFRPSDGSELTYHFDWQDDHSSWRIEELETSIDEAIKLLAMAGERVDKPEHLSDLQPIVRALRLVHRDGDVTDATVRRALALADELDLGDWVESDDANHEYECLIDQVTEALELWDSHQTWVYTEDEFDVAVERLFDRCRNQRNGLGDRWSIVFTDDSVELPDGTVAHGLRPSVAQRKLFDEISIDYAYVAEDDMAQLALAVMRTPDTAVECVSQAVCDLAAGRRMDADAELVDTINALVTRHEANRFEAIIETASRLATEWSGAESELVSASEALVCS